MIYSAAGWAEKKKKGIGHFLFFDGVIKIGGPFAVVMQVIGYFVLADASQSFGQYFGSSSTWVTFFLHATIFGVIMGFINWRRNERANASPADAIKS